MIGANISNILARTLNSNTIEASSHELSRLRHSPGFALELLEISDNCGQDGAIRQSAIIYLKNIVQDHCGQGEIVEPAEMASLRGRLLAGNSPPTQSSSKMSPTRS